MKKVDSVQEQISNVKRKMKSLRNDQKEMLEIKSTARETKNAFDELIRRLDRAKARTSELQDMSTETSQTETHREQE